jgi:hypothetical protein
MGKQPFKAKARFYLESCLLAVVCCQASTMTFQKQRLTTNNYQPTTISLTKP